MGTITKILYKYLKNNASFGPTEVIGSKLNEVIDIVNNTVSGGVTSVNTRVGDVVLNSSDITTALNYTPLNPKIISTGLIAEYRFDEGSGTVLTDYSGNGNNGTYVGSPTMIPGGGFTAGGTTSASQYAIGASPFFTSAQTIYFSYSIAPDGTGNNPIIGNSTGYSNLNILQTNGGVSAQYPSACLYGGIGAGAAGTCNPGDVIPQVPAIIAITIDTNNILQAQVFIEGIEVKSYNGRTLGLNLALVGSPWFGGTNSGSSSGIFTGNIYYAAAYSSYHSPLQILQNTTIIRNLLNNRGTLKPNVYLPNTQTANLLSAGDSLTAGHGGTPYQSLISTKVTFNKYNKGWSGTTASQLSYSSIGLSSLYYSPLASYNIATIFIGTNSIAGGSAYKTAFEQLQSCVKSFRDNGWKIIVMTLINRGDSLAITYPAYIDSFNSLVRASFPDDELCDIAADPILGAAGASSNTTYFQSDFIHLTTTGQQRLADILSAKIDKITNNSRDNKTIYQQTQTVTITNTTIETSCIGTSIPNGIELNNSIFTGNITSGSPTIITIPYTNGFVIGQIVSGTGIPTNSTINSITATSITLNNNATATTANLELTISKLGVRKHSYFWPGKSIIINGKGLISTGTSQTLNKKIKLGSTILGSTGVVTLPSTLTSSFYKYNFEIIPVTIGASGTFQCQGELSVYNTGVWNVYPMTNSSVITVDTTVDNILDITSTWGAASASNIDLCINNLIEKK